jgi:hypothetical protein
MHVTFPPVDLRAVCLVRAIRLSFCFLWLFLGPANSAWFERATICVSADYNLYTRSYNIILIVLEIVTYEANRFIAIDRDSTQI